MYIWPLPKRNASNHGIAMAKCRVRREFRVYWPKSSSGAASCRGQAPIVHVQESNKPKMISTISGTNAHRRRSPFPLLMYAYPSKSRSFVKESHFISNIRPEQSMANVTHQVYAEATDQSHITMHSPSDCFFMCDRDTRVFCLAAPPFRRSSKRSRAFGKFCAAHTR